MMLTWVTLITGLRPIFFLRPVEERFRRGRLDARISFQIGCELRHSLDQVGRVPHNTRELYLEINGCSRVLVSGNSFMASSLVGRDTFQDEAAEGVLQTVLRVRPRAWLPVEAVPSRSRLTSLRNQTGGSPGLTAGLPRRGASPARSPMRGGSEKLPMARTYGPRFSSSMRRTP